MKTKLLLILFKNLKPLNLLNKIIPLAFVSCYTWVKIPGWIIVNVGAHVLKVDIRLYIKNKNLIISCIS